MLMLPHLALAFLGLILQNRQIVVELDDEANEGRYVCGGDEWAFILCDVYALLLQISSLILAWMSRNLPSAFNEKNQLFQVTGLTIVFTIVAEIIAGDVSQPNSAPDSLVGVTASYYVLHTLLVLLLIVQPKINLVWSHKEIVVGQLLRMETLTDSSEGVQHDDTPALPEIILQKKDPLPRQLEVCMYNMLSVLRAVTNRSRQGRPLKLSEWNSLCVETSKLSSWTNRIKLDWDPEGEEPVSQSILPKYDENSNRTNNVIPSCEHIAPSTHSGEILPDEEDASTSTSLDDRLAERLRRGSAGAVAPNDSV